MARRLATDVVLTDAVGGTVTYRAGSTPPAKVAKKITNPDCWEPEEDAPAPVSQPPADPKAAAAAAAAETAAAAAAAAASFEGGAEGGDGEEPARNASTEAWAAYAEGLGQAVKAGAGRDELIAQLAAADLLEA